MNTQFYLVIAQAPAPKHKSHEPEHIQDDFQDQPLTSKELTQAKKLSKALKESPIEINKIYCSPHIASIQTADVCHDRLKISLSAIKDLDRKDEAESEADYNSRIFNVVAELLDLENAYLLICPEETATLIGRHLGSAVQEWKNHTLYRFAGEPSSHSTIGKWKIAEVTTETQSPSKTKSFKSRAAS